MALDKIEEQKFCVALEKNSYFRAQIKKIEKEKVNSARIFNKSRNSLEFHLSMQNDGYFNKFTRDISIYSLEISLYISDKIFNFRIDFYYFTFSILKSIRI